MGLPYLCIIYPIIVCQIQRCDFRSTERFTKSNSGYKRDFEDSAYYPQVKYLSLSNMSDDVILLDSLARYPDVQHLKVGFSKIVELKPNTFPRNIEVLNLSGNAFSEFDFKTVAPRSRLKVLDLSYNKLDSLANFNATNLAELTLLNLFHNQLEFLPEEVVSKFSDDRFSMVIGENPWDCAHSRWRHVMNDAMKDLFCGFSNDTKRVIRVRHEMLSSTVKEAVIYITKSRFTCGFVNCIYWIVGGIWIGVILGNVCNIKRLLFCDFRRNRRRGMVEEKTSTSPF